jgi:biopolymer transport protein ExbB/TolQ
LRKKWHELVQWIATNRGRRLTSLAVPALAILATGSTFLLIALFAPRESYLFLLFFERSWIQPASTFCFWLTMSLLLWKLLSFSFEKEAFERGRAILGDRELATTLTWTDADRVQKRFEAGEHRPHHRSITFTRITKAMDRLRKTQSTGALENYFRTRSDIDASELETSYAGVRYLTWLIPTLGFVGTVMGIGIGISGFASIIQNAQGFQEIQKSLPIVTQALGTAFDTTLLALGLSAIAVFAMSDLLKRQERLLEEIDNLCFDEICALFQEHSTATDEIVEAMSRNINELIVRANGNRAQIEEVIRRELPEALGNRMSPMGGALAAQLDGLARATAEIERLGRAVVALAATEVQRGQEINSRFDDLDRITGLLEQLGGVLTDRVVREALTGREVGSQLDGLALAIIQLAESQEVAAEKVVAELRDLRATWPQGGERVPPVKTDGPEPSGTVQPVADTRGNLP